MRDTSPEIEQRYRCMLLARSGEERLRMGCSMHETAKALTRAAILAKVPAAPEATIRRAMFLRFYGQDFSAAVRERILRHLEAACVST